MTELAPVNRQPAPYKFRGGLAAADEKSDGNRLPDNDQGIGGNETPAPTQEKRRVRLQLTLICLDYNLSWADYSQFPDDLRYTPPHPGDPGARTATVGFSGLHQKSAPGVGFELTFDYRQYLTINLGWSKTADQGVSPGGYANDAELKAIYLTGQDAFTFIAIKRQDSAYFTAGSYAYLDKKEGLAVPVDLGVIRSSFVSYNGWDRFYAIEPYQSRAVIKYGLTTGAFLQYFSFGDSNKTNFTFGFRTGVRFDYFNSKNFALNFTAVAIPFGLNF
ncbi:MAG: hypothetical protein JW873_05310 [Candidatus Saganbacteria bacterium]|nr:hypothetical protein [Candidatus Saganbacteria bacterium]